MCSMLLLPFRPVLRMRQWSSVLPWRVPLMYSRPVLMLAPSNVLWWLALLLPSPLVLVGTQETLPTMSTRRRIGLWSLPVAPMWRASWKPNRQPGILLRSLKTTSDLNWQLWIQPMFRDLCSVQAVEKDQRSSVSVYWTGNFLPYQMCRAP